MKKIFSIVGIAVGAMIIIFGIVMIGMSIGSSYLLSTEFGADFYTYSYRATKAAADNVRALSRIAREGFGFLLIAIGATDVCAFGCKLADSLDLKKASKPAPVAPVAPVATPVDTQ